MDNSMKFTDGIPINRAKDNGGPDKQTPLYEMFGMTEERAEFVKKVCKIAFINAEQKSHVEIDKAFFEVAAKCETLNEFTLAMYTLGFNTARSRDSFGGGGGPVIISMGGMGFGGMVKPGGGGSETGEEPDIEELIRRSRKINGGGEKKKDEDF